MSDRYCKIFYEGKKSDIENLMKEKDWKYELHEMDDKTFICKIGDEFYDELEFFKGMQVDELEITKILDIQEIDELDYNKEVNAIKEKEERDKNQENDDRNADNLKETVQLDDNDDDKERDEVEGDKERDEVEGDKERDEVEGEVEGDKERFEDNNNEETSKQKNIITSEKEKKEHSSPKKQNKNINENKNIEPEEEKNYEKLFDLKDVLLPSKNKLEEKDIMNTLLSKDYLIKFIVIASGVISFLCFFEK